MADANIIVKIVDQTRGGIGSVTNQVDRLGTSATNSTKSFNGMQRAIGAVAAALSVRAFVDFANTVQGIQNRIALINPALGTAAENFKNITDVANRTFQPLSAVADLYQKVARSADQYGLNAQKVTTVTESLTNLLRLSGASGDAAASAIYNFGQALGVGVLRGEDFNAINEATAGEILPVLARELGVASGQVKLLANEGKITGDVLVNALIAAADDTANRVSAMSTTIGQSLTYLNNKFIELGTEANPVFDSIAAAIIFVADNLDTVVAVGATFFTMFAVKKLVDITAGFLGMVNNVRLLVAAMAPSVLAGISSAWTVLTGAARAFTAVIIANPIGAAITAIGLAVAGIYVYWEDLKRIATSAFDAIVLSGLKMQRWFLEFGQNTINSVLTSVENFGIKTIGFFKAIGAAALDPLNAFEAFEAAMEETRQAVENNSVQVVDFSDKIADLDRRIAEASETTNDNTDAVDENAGAVDDNTDATEDNTDATEDNTDATEDLNQALIDQYREYGRAQEAAREMTRRYQEANEAIDESIAAYDNETYAMGLAEDQRDILNRIIQEEQSFRESLGDTVADLSAEQIRLIYEVRDAEELAALDFIQLSDDKISAIYEQVEARQAQVQAEREAAQAEREAQRAAAEAQREEERETARIRREQQRIVSEFTRDTERLNQSYYEATTSRVQQLEDEKQDYIRRARELGLENERATQDAILEYNRAINEAIVDQHEEALREQQRALDEFRSEYDMIYDDIYGVIEDFTGLSSRELERYNQYAKLLLGVDILGAVDGFVDGALMSIGGFNTQGQQQFVQLADGSVVAMQNAGNIIGTGIFGTQGTAAQGIGGFIGYALQAFGINGGGLLGAVTTLFGGLGGTLSNLFNNIFGFIGNGISGIGNFLSGAFSGVGNFVSSAVSGVSGFLGNIVSGISGFFGDIFGGFFDRGGYISGSQVGIVGEYGPELVRGPAMVTGRDATRRMNTGSVNVNFTINAVDAQGIDQLLINRKPLITDIVRDAVRSEGVF